MEDAHERDTGRVTHNVYFYHIAQSNAKISRSNKNKKP